MPLPKHFSGKEISLPATQTETIEVPNRKKINWGTPNKNIIIGSVVGLLLAGAFYFLVPSNFRANLFNLAVIVIALLTFVYALFKQGKLTNALIIAVVVWLLVGYFWVPISYAISFVTPDRIEQSFAKVENVVSPDTLLNKLGLNQGPLAQAFGVPQAKAPSQTNLDIIFPNPVSSAPLSVAADVKIKTQESVKLTYTCLLDGKPIEAEPKTQDVEGSPGQQSFRVICTGPQGGKELVLKVLTPYRVESNLPVSIGNVARTGAKPSTMPFDSPYALSLDLAAEQPLADRAAPYPINVNFLRKESGYSLISIESLDLESQSQRYIVSCLNPLSSLSFKADSTDLARYVIDKNRDNYAFACSINVNSAPEEGTEQSFINAKASYITQKEFKTTLSGNTNVA